MSKVTNEMAKMTMNEDEAPAADAAPTSLTEVVPHTQPHPEQVSQTDVLNKTLLQAFDKAIQNSMLDPKFIHAAQHPSTEMSANEEEDAWEGSGQ